MPALPPRTTLSHRNRRSGTGRCAQRVGRDGLGSAQGVQEIRPGSRRSLRLRPTWVHGIGEADIAKRHGVGFTALEANGVIRYDVSRLFVFHRVLKNLRASWLVLNSLNNFPPISRRLTLYFLVSA